MLEHVDQDIIFVVLWNPVAHAFHMVAIEDLGGVVAKTSVKVFELARVCVIGPKLINMIGAGGVRLSHHAEAQHSDGAHGEGSEMRNFHAMQDIASDIPSWPRVAWPVFDDRIAIYQRPPAI